jgi:hypothetical protein
MKTFIFKILAYLFFFFLIIFIGIKLPSKDKEIIMYAIKDKKIKVDSIKIANPSSPIIYFVGGSNAIFSINTKRVSDSLKTPAYNLAIHAGYGMKFDLENAFNFAKANDVIILSPEYENFWKFNSASANGQLELLYTLLEIYPEGWKLIDYKQKWAIIQFLPRYLHDKYLSTIFGKNKRKNTIYYRTAFNDFGDLISHENLSGNKIIPIPKIPYKIDENALHFLKTFNQKCIDNKIKFYILPPAYQISSFENNKEIRVELYEHIAKQNIKIIGTPQTFCYADTMFLDTYYHTLVPAREHRTDRIIHLLRLNNIVVY